MSEDAGQPAGRQRFSVRECIHVGLPIALALIVARLVADAIVESLGHWPSIGIGTVAALAVGIVGSVALQRILYRA